jgi:hypothetical protein
MRSLAIVGELHSEQTDDSDQADDRRPDRDHDELAMHGVDLAAHALRGLCQRVERPGGGKTGRLCPRRAVRGLLEGWSRPAFGQQPGMGAQLVGVFLWHPESDPDHPEIELAIGIAGRGITDLALSIVGPSGEFATPFLHATLLAHFQMAHLYIV